MVNRVLVQGDEAGQEQFVLTGTWSGQTTPRVLAHARPLERRG
jgi:hypothetical protein